MMIKALVFTSLCAVCATPVAADDTTSNKQPPPATDVQGAGSLSDKLSQSNGVIHPAQNADPGIAKTPPTNGSTPMPVIPPPGTPGGDPSVKPK